MSAPEGEVGGDLLPVELQVDVLDDFLKGVGVVDGIPEARCVHYCQSWEREDDDRVES